MAETKKPDTTQPMRFGGSPVRNPSTTRPFRTVPNVLPGAPPALDKTNPVLKPEQLVTEGMLARRRDIERKKREARFQRMEAEEQSAESWRGIRRALFAGVLVVAALFAYLRLQTIYGNSWPLMDVWLFIALVICGGMGWAIWYTSKSDL